MSFLHLFSSSTLSRFSRNNSFMLIGGFLGISAYFAIVNVWGLMFPTNGLYGNQVNPDYAVVLFHGYGSSGTSFERLSVRIENMLPETHKNRFVYYTPKAPNTLSSFRLILPATYFWLESSRRLDTAHEVEAMYKYVDVDTEYVKGLIDESIVEKYGLPYEKIFLIGFSEGGTVVTHIATDIEENFAGIISASAVKRAENDSGKTSTHTATPVLVMHNDDDFAIDVRNAGSVRKMLTEKGYNVETEISKTGGHGISRENTQTMVDFMVRNSFF